MDIAVAIISGFVKIIVALLNLLFQLFTMTFRALMSLTRSR